MGDLLLGQVSELVHVRCAASCNALGKFDEATNGGPLADGVLCSQGLDLDDADTWVIWAAVVLA